MPAGAKAEAEEATISTTAAAYWGMLVKAIEEQRRVREDFMWRFKKCAYNKSCRKAEYIFARDVMIDQSTRYSHQHDSDPSMRLLDFSYI